MALAGRIGRMRGTAAMLLAAAWLMQGCAGSPVAAAVAPPQAAAVPRPANDAYRIAPGDEIAVTFPYNAELDHAGPVGPDGRFAMPLVGNIPLEGRTIDEVAALISTDLRRQGVVEDARPTVAIRQYGAVIYVGGEVRQPGAIKLTQAMDPMQAVISAGGMLDTAKTRQIVVIHRTPEGTIVQRHADLRRYAKHGETTGIDLQPQDIVFVPRSSIAEADLWIDQHINKLLPFSRSLNYSLGNNAVVTR